VVGLILVAMLTLMFPLIEGRQLDWPLWAFVSMAASLAVFALFAVSQIWKGPARRIAAGGAAPFRARSFVAGIVVQLSFYAVVSAFFLVLTLFLQVGLATTY